MYFYFYISFSLGSQHSTAVLVSNVYLNSKQITVVSLHYCCSVLISALTFGYLWNWIFIWFQTWILRYSFQDTISSFSTPLSHPQSQYVQYHAYACKLHCTSLHVDAAALDVQLLYNLN